jgi:hypothetical protein
MAQAEARGGTSEVYPVHLAPPIAITRNKAAYVKSKINDFSIKQASLLSAAPLTQAQIELGQQIARKHGLTA